MKTFQTEITITSPQRGTYNITKEIDKSVTESGIKTGLCHVFIQHTSASLIITENADPTVREDIEYWMQKTVKDGDPSYRHNYEGDDDMSAHIRCMITDMSQTIPISHGRLNLGTWQGLFLYEHRTGRFNRKVVITIQGE
ncbi:secondary thiamine-phosphate synthase enzyme YjbQ [Thiomicrorhabdus sp. ZW0627]|uniref:secondary thiamine-phosphate synthase enzyme YjbQ n=1 Tax=Thiomicrorhabdus sp. ZW0627 TaxID=3039774 RepID=UPI00243705BE|nr:secondary thiamine-phosphate synthase enzyme YjbQ [Thiomicrorhabdus sp. ZW0627]MDG6774219.1 secondary thiamine-phosphate synthase enzyme YjbQ [Thiomicrorhabdus sp. ZW0627]